MVTKICDDLPEIWMVLREVWLYIERVLSFKSGILECQFLRWMVVIEGKAWFVIVKNKINPVRTDQHNTWKSIISRTLPTSEQHLKIITLRITNLGTSLSWTFRII